MSSLRPKTIILSAAQSVRPIRASINGDGSLLVGHQTIADYDSLMDDSDVLDSAVPYKRRRLNFLSPEQKLVRRSVDVCSGFVCKCCVGGFSINSCFVVHATRQ